MRVNRSMPSSTVIPVLAYDDVGEAVEWLSQTFGFSERWRAASHRVQLSVGDGAIVVTEARGELSSSHACHSLMVRIEDVDDHYERARDGGARILDAPADHPYGERQYTAEDLGGHRWTFSQSIADVAPEDWGGASSTP